MAEATLPQQNITALVQKVNQMLLAGEPDNISVDTYGGYTGYKPQYIIDAMNTVFGIGGWGFEEMSSDLQSSEKGGLIVAKVLVWLAGVEFHPTGWGQARVTKGDIGDAHKGAQTDAIKKALSYFSVGNRAYQGLLPGLPDKQEQAGNANRRQERPTNQQPAARQERTIEGRQQTSVPQPAKQSESMQELIRKAIARARTSGISGQPAWDNFVSQVLGQSKPANQITVADIALINGMLTKREQNAVQMHS